MNRIGNILLGALGLALLQGLVSGSGASNVGSVLSGAGKAVSWFVDPSVPAFSASSVSQPTGAAVATYTAPTSSGGSTYISPTLNQPGAVEIPGVGVQSVAEA